MKREPSKLLFIPGLFVSKSHNSCNSPITGLVQDPLGHTFYPLALRVANYEMHAYVMSYDDYEDDTKCSVNLIG